MGPHHDPPRAAQEPSYDPHACVSWGRTSRRRRAYEAPNASPCTARGAPTGILSVPYGHPWMRSRGGNAVVPCHTAPRHHGHVVGEAVEGGRAITERVGLVEVQPADPPPCEHVIEVHAHAHEARGGPAGQLVHVQLVALREGVDPRRTRDEV